MKLKLYKIILIIPAICLFASFLFYTNAYADIGIGASPGLATPLGAGTSAPAVNITTQSGSSVGALGKLENPELPTYGMTWDKILQNVYSIIAFFVGSALVIMFLVGGVMYITSAGNEEQASKGAKTVTAAVIGFVMIALAYGIITFVAQLK